MSDPARGRINAAFDEELAAAPVPPGLRALSIRAATAASRRPSGRPVVLAFFAAALIVALVATLVVGSHALRPIAEPVRSRPAPSAFPPQPRAGAGLVYDAAHDELVLFGGSANYGVVNETWTWDGNAWRLYRLAVAPGRRLVGAMAYDELRKDVVMFGGIAQVASGKGGQAPVDDTWVWDGSRWQERHPRHQPALSYDWAPTMAYDPVSKTVILYGFQRTTGEAIPGSAQTWSWNGSDWSQLAPTTTPTKIGQLVGDGEHLYFLGPAAERVGGRDVTQLWLWDGTTWTLLNRSNNFGIAFGGSAVFDRERKSLVAFDGDTWTWDGSSWMRQHPTTESRTTGYMAYFAALHEVVMWGDLSGQWSNDVWAWNGVNWRLAGAGTAQPLPSPPPGQFGPLTPAAASALIRQVVKNSSPVLLPALIPAGMEADGMASADDFDVAYQSDQRDKSILIGMVAANPPPGDARSTDTLVKFRHVLAMKYRSPGYAEYFVYDPTAPLSDRWLMWLEPGTMSVQGSTTSGVWYFMSASGLTDAQFWQVANSLR